MSLDKAIEKIKSEIASGKNNGYVKVVGDFLLQHLEENPDFAAHVLAESKTISKSLDAMRKIAMQKKVDNVAVLSDPEGFAIVVKYFAEPAPTPATAPVEQTVETKEAPAAAAPPEKAPEPEGKTESEEAAEDEEDFDFDALLG